MVFGAKSDNQWSKVAYDIICGKYDPFMKQNVL